MLKWKRMSITAASGVEKIDPILAGMSGKNRVIKFIAFNSHIVDQRVRVYRDADQIVDYDCRFLTDEAPLLPMDLPLAEGQLCSAGFLNNAGVESTRVIAIGYEETG